LAWLEERLTRWPGLRAVAALVRKARAVAEPPHATLRRAEPWARRRLSTGNLTVMSANLWHDWPRHRRLAERLEAFARLAEAEGADIILLQEVAHTPHIRVDDWLAERLGMARAYTRANGAQAAIGFEEGLAVLSRFPLESPRLLNLRSGAGLFVRRVALGAEVGTPHGNLLAISVHLGLLSRQNARQIEDLRAWVATEVGNGPALIGGDFNAHEASPQIRRAQHTWLDTFRQLHPYSDGTTHEWRCPWGGVLHRRRLDYLFLHPGLGRWVVDSSRHLEARGRPHSDHRAVLARLVPSPAAS
jgi:endonuclease/exonuclease/phosphatase family metal-dependent hydrolase